MNHDTKVAIISGGGGHIGRYTALKFASQGYAIAVCDINADTAQRVVDEILATNGDAVAVQVDVQNSVSVNNAVAATVERYGTVDVLVTAAGGSARSRIKPL
ncbi:MAG TPA: SDR family NAD(P)-dependent oxidoreductase, partial [Armatimonadota bacterium]|nr:SDR family NAD(P)-dependent oxidoreductase [Armatimonadota bacterium]